MAEPIISDPRRDDQVFEVRIKSAFFTMFLFAVGHSVGPQFVRGVAKDGAPQAVFAVVICALCLTCTYLVAKIAGFDVAYTAGMLAGAFALGLDQDNILI
jgi:putative transport protein